MTVQAPAATTCLPVRSEPPAPLQNKRAIPCMPTQKQLPQAVLPFSCPPAPMADGEPLGGQRPILQSHGLQRCCRNAPTYAYNLMFPQRSHRAVEGGREGSPAARQPLPWQVSPKRPGWGAYKSPCSIPARWPNLTLKSPPTPQTSSRSSTTHSHPFP